METSSDISPRKARRKPRRTPVRDRERCLDAVVRDGRFVLPMDAKNAGPVAYWLNNMSVLVYNRVGDLFIAKDNLKTVITGADGAELIVLKSVLAFINNEIRLVRHQGFKLRKYVLNVEKCQAINEPLVWARG